MDMNHSDIQRDIHSDEQRLIGLIASNDATAVDWRSFQSLATTDPGAWGRLARSLRDELHLRAAFDLALDPMADDGDEVAAPDAAPQPIGRIGGWPGWAVAAMLVLAWGLSQVFAPGAGAPINRAGPGAIQPAAFNTADDAYRNYIELGAEEGRVLRELPKLMVETRIIGEEGGQPLVEVVFVRQLLERTRIHTAYQINRDEFGRETPVQINLASFTSEGDS